MLRGHDTMMTIGFKVIKDALRCGREIEFTYKGKQYSITNSHGYWQYCCDTDEEVIDIIGAIDNR